MKNDFDKAVEIAAGAQRLEERLASCQDRLSKATSALRFCGEHAPREEKADGQ